MSYDKDRYKRNWIQGVRFRVRVGIGFFTSLILLVIIAKLFNLLNVIEQFPLAMIILVISLVIGFVFASKTSDFS